MRGGGSKIDLGKPMRCDQILDLSGLSGIVDYAPEELVVTLRAGTPMREVEALLAQRNQMLAFEPPDLGPLLGRAAGEGTLVGTIMGNFAGPRRLSAGAARDHLLGFSGVNGRGEAFKSGGRVMKNVTGYDLSKLLAGSWGTLAVLDEVSVKVLPAPDQTRTLLLHGLADEAAVTAMCAAMGSPHEVSGARACRRAHGVARRRRRAVGRGAPEGPARALPRREDGRARHARNRAPSGARCATRFRSAPMPDDAIWRISCAPTDGAAVVARIKAGQPSAKAFYDWSGGLIWLALPVRDDADHALVAPVSHGHATLIRAPEAVRAAVPVFQPLSPALAALSAAREGKLRPEGPLQSRPNELMPQCHLRSLRQGDDRGQAGRLPVPGAAARALPHHPGAYRRRGTRLGVANGRREHGTVARMAQHHRVGGDRRPTSRQPAAKRHTEEGRTALDRRRRSGCEPG